MSLDALVLEPTPAGVRAGLIEGGRLVELAFEDGPEEVGERLFLGRVRRVDPALDAAFVDIGLEAPAWLAARDARLARGPGERAPIARLVHEGEAVLVQGRREGRADKGPRVTTDLTFLGFHLLYHPRSPTIEISRQLGGRLRYEQLERARDLFPEGGFVLRAAAAAADDAALLAEAELLRGRFAAAEAEARRRTAPARLDDADGLERLLVRCLSPGVGQVLVADRTLHLRTRKLLEARLPGLAERLERLSGRGSAFERAGIAEQLEQALSREVRLEGGGRLLIEPTAALIAIDVDGGGRGRAEALALNLEAAAEAARQIRLRNLAGAIVIDFVAMGGSAERARLMRELRHALIADPEPVQLYPMSPLGLVQLSRRRRGLSLEERYLRACRACGGSGREPAEA